MQNASALAMAVLAILASGSTVSAQGSSSGVTGPSATGHSAAGTVRIESGLIEGTQSGGVLSFKGIPYAKPPVGKLRWREPQPVDSWAGTKSAHTFGHDCMQKPESGGAAPIATDPSEDCLTLNVWGPASMAPGSRLPVLVWIHGGAFVNGGSSPAEYDGSAFARDSLVFVSFNYRLGRFGFFAHPALSAAQETPQANFGYLDQLAALRWVKRNIASFSGDPDQVTVIGESAGGASILDLVASRASRGLFSRAIVLSGGGRKLLGGLPLKGGSPGKPSAERIGLNFAESAGIRGKGSRALAALRALPAEKVRGNLNMSSLLEPARKPTYAGGPIVDGKTFFGPPGETLAMAGAARIAMLIGTTDRDLGLVFARSKEDAFAGFGADSAAARSAYDPAGSLPDKDVVSAIGADRTMTEPARFVSRRVTDEGGPAWLYRFSYVADSLQGERPGATHASEIPYAFSTLAVRYGSKVTGSDLAMGATFHAYLANFAKRGDPNAAGLTIWPKYDLARSDLMEFCSAGIPVYRADPWKKRLDLVEASAGAGAMDEYDRYLLASAAEAPGNGSVKATYLGASSLLFDDGDAQILLDGYFTRFPAAGLREAMAAMVRTDTAAVDAALSRAGIDRLKGVFISHSHFDHAMDAPYVAAKTGAVLYGSPSTLNIGRGGGLSDGQLAPFEPGKAIRVGRFTVTPLKSKHAAPRPGINDDMGGEITNPLRQPAPASAYKEGGTYDLLVEHGGRGVLVIGSPDFIPGALDTVRAEAVFLSLGGNLDRSFLDAYYGNTVGRVHPRLVVPVHWDDFTKPLGDHLEPMSAAVLHPGFDFLIERTAQDRIRFGILQGYQGVLLFGGVPARQARGPEEE
jgi:para-nitrobenzyl esterase